MFLRSWRSGDHSFKPRACCKTFERGTICDFPALPMRHRKETHHIPKLWSKGRSHTSEDIDVVCVRGRVLPAIKSAYTIPTFYYYTGSLFAAFSSGALLASQMFQTMVLRHRVLHILSTLRRTSRRSYAQFPPGGGAGGFPGMQLNPGHQKGETLKEFVSISLTIIWRS